MLPRMRSTTRAAWLLLLWTWIGSVWADPSYRIDYRFTLRAGAADAEVEMRYTPGGGRVERFDFNLPSARYTPLAADGSFERRGERALWRPPARGGTVRFRVVLDQRRDDGRYSAHRAEQWAIFRGDRVFPAARLKTSPGAYSTTRVSFVLPKEWGVDTPYPKQADGGFLVDFPGRRFDRPVGWMIIGRIGIRRERIDGTEWAVAAPMGHAVRRMDLLAFVTYAAPSLSAAFGPLPDKVLIVLGPEPMWRGGLSAPRSLFLHADRPLISENGTSTLLHELTHSLTRIRAEGDADWIAEGLAEFYAVELLRRSGGMTAERHQRVLAWLKDWSRKVKSLRTRRAKAEVTARAALLFVDLDREIRDQSRGRHDLDDLNRRLMQLGKVSEQELRAQVEDLIGAPARTLDTPLLKKP